MLNHRVKTEYPFTDLEIEILFLILAHALFELCTLHTFCCTVGQRKKKEKRNTPIYFNTNYRTEMKLVPVMMD